MQRRWSVCAALAAAALLTALGTPAARAANTTYANAYNGPGSANYPTSGEPNLFYTSDITNGAAVAADATSPTGTTQTILEHLSAVGGLAGDTFTRVADFGPSNDQLWHILNGSSGTVTVTARFAGDVSQFGTYSSPYSSFTPATDVSNNPLYITGKGYNAQFNTASNGSGTNSSSATYTGTNPIAFGLYDTSTNTYLSSIDTQNLDHQNHMVAFAINGGKDGYLLAFEDRLKTQNSDFDHNDAVVQIQGAAPTPEPTTMILALTALPVLGLARRLRKGGATA